MLAAALLLGSREAQVLICGGAGYSYCMADEEQNNPLALRIVGLRKAFGDVQAVDGLNLEVRRGECFGLLGPNGAGKTTTIEICEGLTAADAGVVELLGLNWGRNAHALRQKVGIQLQETQFPDKLTVEETIGLFRSFYRQGPTVDELIHTVELEEKRTARVVGLSGGQKQRLAMATALAGDPELIFLDEPTTGLDPQARRHLWELVEALKSAGRTIILTTHYMDEAERLSDRVAIMDHGKVIAQGTPRELIALAGGEDIVEISLAKSVPLSAERLEVLGLQLEALDGVREHRLADGTHRLAVSALHKAAPAILATLEAEGLPLSEFRTHSATLEDVFVHLTGRNLRDE